MAFCPVVTVAATTVICFSGFDMINVAIHFRPNGNMVDQEYLDFDSSGSTVTTNFEYNLSPEQINKIKRYSDFCIQDIGYNGAVCHFKIIRLGDRGFVYLFGWCK